MGITKNITALSRGTLTFIDRSEISNDTKEMYSMELNVTTHKEASLARR